MGQSRLKQAVIGLDGATLDVILPLARQGLLPHLGRTLSEGAYGVLSSVIPPVTGPAWSVLATGQNPGRLGTFDFLNRRRQDDHILYPIRSHHLAGNAFWDIMGAAGYRMGILNYPMLVPAYPVNGWMVGGLGASRFHRLAFPRELGRELDRVTGGYQISISYGLPRYRQRLPRLVQDMKRLLAKRLRALEHLLSSRPVDVLVAVFTVSDVASHTMWHCWEPGDTEQFPGSSQREMRDEFVAVWQALDGVVGRVLEHLAPDGHALIVSDHGFGSSHGVFHVNCWLEQRGYLQRSDRTGEGNHLREWLVTHTGPWFGPLYRKMLGSRAHQLLRPSVLRAIDLTRSQAFALETSDQAGAVFFNRLYARVHGLDEGAFVSQLCAQLTRDLLAWGDEQQLDIQVFAAKEIYAGEKVPLAPELLFVVDHYRCSVSPRLEEPIYSDRRYHPMKSGTHRLDGILIATGPRILGGSLEAAQLQGAKLQGAKLQGAKLQDVAPTLLHLLDLPVPSSMDGRVLTEVLRPEYRLADRSQPSPTGPVPSSKGEPGAEKEGTRVLLQRLRDLGYLD